MIHVFDFDGEFLVSNRGLIEFQEILKLQTEFLYDLLGATQEHRVKPRRFNQVPIDEVILGHTNNAEFEKLTNNKFMEALRDRTIKIDIPYLLKITEEKKIYDHFYNEKTLISTSHLIQHICCFVRSCKSFRRKHKARHEHHSKRQNFTTLECPRIY